MEEKWIALGICLGATLVAPMWTTACAFKRAAWLLEWSEATLSRLSRVEECYVRTYQHRAEIIEPFRDLIRCAEEQRAAVVEWQKKSCVRRVIRMVRESVAALGTMSIVNFGAVILAFGFLRSPRHPLAWVEQTLQADKVTGACIYIAVLTLTTLSKGAATSATTAADEGVEEAAVLELVGQLEGRERGITDDV